MRHEWEDNGTRWGVDSDLGAIVNGEACDPQACDCWPEEMMRLVQEVARLDREVEEELRGQVEISTAAGGMADKWRDDLARLRPLLERLLARLERRDLGEPCTAVLRHGPGHQSRTTCNVRGTHLVHRCVFGRYDQEASWTEPEATTGYFDEAPESEAEEPYRPDDLLADLRRELGKETE